MKFSKLVLTSILTVLLSLFVASAFADQSDCDEEDFVHCIFSTDKQDPLNPYLGNYVRLSFPTLDNESHITCLPYSSVIYFDSETAEEYHYPLGKNEMIIEVCSDEKCTQSAKVADDVFILTKDSSGNYYADPKTYGYSFSRYYPAVTCPPDEKRKTLKIKTSR